MIEEINQSNQIDHNVTKYCFEFSCGLRMIPQSKYFAISAIRRSPIILISSSITNNFVHHVFLNYNRSLQPTPFNKKWTSQLLSPPGQPFNNCCYWKVSRSIVFELKQRWGFGNWYEIRDYMEYFGVKFTEEQIEEHYNKYFLNEKTYYPVS